MAAFLGFALVGCSDDVIDAGGQENQLEKTPAYLTVAFSSNATSSRSTADDANNQGDQDGETPESSGHTNVGTGAENAINSALIVIKETEGDAGFAKLYVKADLAIPSPKGSSFSTVEPIKVNTGIYDVLVVANPYESLLSDAVRQGTEDQATVTNLYNKILIGDYAVTSTTVDNFAGDIVQVENNSLTGIMMTNKAMATVEVKAGNLEYNPASVDVQIERVASKITYRHYGYDGQQAVEITDANKDNVIADVYPVNVTLPSKVSPITYNFSYTIGDPTDTAGQLVTVNETLNEALCNGEKVYVVLENNAFKCYYKGEDVLINNGNVTIKDPVSQAISDVPNFPFIFQYKADEAANMPWFVKIEKYALVNLSKSVYNVRHTTFNGTAVQFGTLTGSNYLYTPLWKTQNGSVAGINEVNFWSGKEDNFDATKNQIGDFSNIENTDVWFFNSLDDVSGASKAAEPTQFFQTFASSTMGNANGTPGVTGDGDKQHKEPLSPIGDLLAYCLENSTDVDHQRHALSTGIAFMAKIYANEQCTEPIQTLYRYAGHLFTTIADIQKAYNVTPEAGAKGLEGLTEKSDADALKAAGVVKYAGNTCYYYSTEIKHWDNGVPEVLGNMEFAIMRNNIYSLAVTGINIIGDPYVDPTPSTPNEVLDTYLNIEAKIEPWIVRYHDIEFN